MVQVVELKVPEALLLNVTVPVGAILVPDDVSVTVAVQVADAFTGSVAGAQVTLVEVERLMTVRLKVPELVR